MIENDRYCAPKSAIVLGEQSLLIQCVEVLIDKGCTELTLVTKNPDILAWAIDRQLTVVEKFELLDGHDPVDALFSITNLRVLPEWVLALGSYAVNFHDGPLPRYAGLNAPVWALLNDEADHGVSWHEMLAGVDEGRILEQKLFPIVPGETALSINAKCYQAGLESFTRLIDSICTNSVSSVAQNLTLRSYFGKHERPENLALIDWSKPKKFIERLVRALDHGSYANPLALPKLLIENELWSFDSFESAGIGPHSSDKPGVVIELVNKPKDETVGSLYSDFPQINVACLDGVICFKGLKQLTSAKGDLDRSNVDALPMGLVGQILPVVDPDLALRLKSAAAAAARSESFWGHAIAGVERYELPYELESNSVWASKDISLADNPETVLALINCYFARISRKDAATFVVLKELESDLQPFFESRLPFRFALESNASLEQASKTISNALARLQSAHAPAIDFIERDPQLRDRGQMTQDLELVLVSDLASYHLESAPLTESSKIRVVLAGDGNCRWYFPQGNEALIDRILRHLSVLYQNALTQPELALNHISMVSAQEQRALLSAQGEVFDFDQSACLHTLFEAQACSVPDSIALVCEGESFRYRDLNGRANQIARHLQQQGVKNGDVVGVMVDRSFEMVASLFAVHKVGAAYLPLDPVYPLDRLLYMIEDSSSVKVISTSEHAQKLSELSDALVLIDQSEALLAGYSTDNLAQSVDANQLAYLIYTSGSTGKPKGVRVPHKTVVNFFAGMDDVIEPDAQSEKTWLAVTSISFDISVLELFWTLANGFKVVLYRDRSKETKAQISCSSDVHQEQVELDFSLFYWNVAEEADVESEAARTDKYRLLTEGAKFADQHGFKAVWNPERHFAAFGGLFPNPAVTLSALALVTENIDLRAGSCVIPLHSPIRVAEDYAVLDNLSKGRVGIAVASGWAPPDFAIKPENYKEAKRIMFESLDQVRKLWRGETLNFEGPAGEVPVRTLPRPIQKELPHWVTTAGNIDTFRSAGKAGSNILTHLLGQTFEEVQEKIAAYRDAWRDAGHKGEGIITLMLHTFVGEDMEQIENAVRQPMKNYLKSAMFLVKGAAWNFPTFKKMSEETGKSLDEFFETISDQDLDDLLEFAFQRYFRTSGLFGTPEIAAEIAKQCYAIGVNEIACLVDFGVDTDVVMQHLPYLNRCRELAQQAKVTIKPTSSEQHSEAAKQQDAFSLPRLFQHYKPSHFQCTPSMATMLLSDDEAKVSMRGLKHMMVGGEALPQTLAENILSATGGRLTNMYGPTETTIWSTTSDIQSGSPVTIGRAIANTHVYVVDQYLNVLPSGVAGELLIGGEGVVQGYHRRPELTDERFVSNFIPYTGASEERVYRTGDLAKIDKSGRLIYLGRADYQVKIRGYRIELGEIDSVLSMQGCVLEAAVLLREDRPGDKRLVAYVKLKPEYQLDDALIAELKASLMAELPEFMVPSLFVNMPRMPLTPNGKLDRNALPVPVQVSSELQKNTPELENDWESLVADIWQRALGISSVSRRDNFFDIGGHSLLVIQVLKELREHEKIVKAVQMTDLFRYTTVETLAAFIATDSNQSPSDNRFSDSKSGVSVSEPSAHTATETLTESTESNRVAARKAAMLNRRKRR